MVREASENRWKGMAIAPAKAKRRFEASPAKFLATSASKLRVLCVFVVKLFWLSMKIP